MADGAHFRIEPVYSRRFCHMFSYLFLCLSGAIDESHSLVPPFRQTGIREIGNWSLLGHSVSRKRVIHFTANVSSSSGGLCHRVPTLSADWVSEFEFVSVSDTFQFGFSHQFCPEVEHYDVLVSFIPGADEGVEIRLRGVGVFSPPLSMAVSAGPLRVRVTKSAATIDVSVKNKSLSANLTMEPYGYFSIGAVSPADCVSCSTEFLSFRHFLSSSESNAIDPGLPEQNRKTLDLQKRKRRISKMHRRAKMLVVSKYLKQKADLGERFDGQTVELREALSETSEMVGRANGSISAENLSKFIHVRLMPVLQRADARYSRVADALWNMKTEMLSLWDDVKRDLRRLNREIRQACGELEGEALEMGRVVQGQLLPQSLFVEEGEVGAVQKGMFGVAVIEFASFVVFFIRYHRKRLGRKRV
jgi:hypothetical protein